jgi:hypothetical protein
MGIHTYATFGMTLLALKESTPHGVELYSGVSQGSIQFRDALTTLASNARDSRTVFRDCQILDEQSPVTDGYAFTGWIFFDRSKEILPRLKLSNGCHVEFLDTAPIFQSEVWLCSETRRGRFI